MTGPDFEAESPGTRPISVAELLAKNGTIGAPAVTRRRRRRRGDSDSVTVAELTGEIPIIRDDDEEEAEPAANGTAAQVAEPPRPTRPEPTAVAPERPAQVTKDQSKSAYWSEPEPRWPKSPPQPKRPPGPERSEYPRPLRHGDAPEKPERPRKKSGAEDMSFDPMDHYADLPVDVMDSEVREAQPGLTDSAYVRSFLGEEDHDEDDETGRGDARSLTAGADEVEDDHAAAERADAHAEPGRFAALWRGAVVVFQSILAVAFGAGLFVAFDQLWRWNSIVALVLSVLVILGLVVGVRVVRKTEDIASTLIAVAVGALITLGPLALSLQSG
ncbi:MAG: hypothetical protein JOZ00_07285 [Mycobacterium sp.]|uniref:hypothetical protein n=1 Tax=Mycobacterium sp. TaxID=1785 RepID=UPI001ED57B5B|nr:hypothetical protein [Mycobacterium sp.]MBV8786477.1 hypothetical protein [Mycobacterium sp.]